MKTTFLLILSALFVGACSYTLPFNAEEAALIAENSGVMRVYRIDRKSDSLFLRKKAAPLINEAFETKEYKMLKARMLETVNDTSNPGVGIAAPQVGISRCLIAVQRFDKSGEPFEFYANPRIVYYSEDRFTGLEGCLSIPDVGGEVIRSTEIIVSYTDENTMEIKQDTVKGFTAVIFQHETDHLNGILFTDHMPAEK